MAALYLLGRDLFDKRVGLAAGIIIALSPLQLFYAQEARMYTQLVCLTILSSWFLFRALQADGWWWWVLFGLGATLASYTAYFAFPVWAAMGAYVVFVDRRRPQIIKFLPDDGRSSRLVRSLAQYFSKPDPSRIRHLLDCPRRTR